MFDNFYVQKEVHQPSFDFTQVDQAFDEIKL